jgi:hypothetical protein
MCLIPHVPVALTQHCGVLYAAALWEDTMHTVDQHTQCDDDDEAPIAPPAPPDPLTVIFEWIEHDADALEGAPQAPTVQHPVPQEQARTAPR